ncbi:MAG: hypothetical protein K2Y35_20205 [Burkholderiales bacterium]|nr:hypothetical protein [Burkholderiales bacterium]
MDRCATCGNEYTHSFTLSMDTSTYTFDSFECAIHLLAPSCAHCSCRILGHGVEVNERVYCCAHCPRADGRHGAIDNA